MPVLVPTEATRAVILKSLIVMSQLQEDVTLQVSAVHIMSNAEISLSPVTLLLLLHAVSLLLALSVRVMAPAPPEQSLSQV